MSPDYARKYDRNGPEIFVGEWAAHEDAKIKPWDAALAEATANAVNEGRPWRRRFHGGDGAEFRSHPDAMLRAVVRQRESRRAAVAAGLDRLRRAFGSTARPVITPSRCSAEISAMKFCPLLRPKRPSKAAPRVTARPAKLFSSW